jgi:hypothetical protein
MQQRKPLARTIALVARRPRLVPLVLGAAWRFRRRGWWRRFPFLPMPSSRYLDWRLDTAFGEAGEPGPEQLERYLRWTRRMTAGR